MQFLSLLVSDEADAIRVLLLIMTWDKDWDSKGGMQSGMRRFWRTHLGNENLSPHQLRPGVDGLYL